MRLYIDGIFIPHKLINYPAGEIGVILEPQYPQDINGTTATVIGSIPNTDSLMRVGLLIEAVRYHNDTVLTCLVSDFISYGRQDARKQSEYEAKGCDVMATFINSLELDVVCIGNPHSDESIAKIRNVEVDYSLVFSSIFPIINRFYIKEYSIDFNDVVLVAPDQNALNIVSRFNELIGKDNDEVSFIKTRNPNNDSPLLIEPHKDIDVIDRHCLIVDDICDGGDTFIQVKNLLMDNGASSVSLYITAGLFTKGNLFDGFANVWCNFNLNPFT